MDNNSFMELKNKIAALPVLQERMKSLSGRLYQAQDDVKSLLRRYQSEALDVDGLQEDKLSNTLLKLIGMHEGKVHKETREMLSAKLEYDKAVERVKLLTDDRAELAGKISELAESKKNFDAEFERRESLLRSRISGEAFISYTQLENRQLNLSRQLAETEEAIHAADRVIAAASSALGHLDSAEGWATYDLWSRGGILNHMAKYEHIDDAQAQLNHLSSLIKDFENELEDVNMQQVCQNVGIDSTTRAVDFWFDNIFTDLNVRDKIREDISQVNLLISQVEGIINKLESNKAELVKGLNEAQRDKDNLVMGFEIS
ncbi:hypothetical protein CLHUN_19190 [Ruminiclostridium hungatei]|uniref:Uncharacterized protein n=1 Tax=Ruminiclostridium hungatei TaxID=48256 RepID=A0A1V4SJS8_RUMHU|nr:hypothetical protein [Ruminiclostridium hungatei]OPX44120.1 hypothetical protein CLHUN_19190 [Ruminiclostridium hungatei]